MATSRTSLLSEIIAGGPIPVGKLTYFRERLRQRLHELVLVEFLRKEKARELTRADLARRIGKKPEQVTRWLGAPGNWTLDTVSDLLLGMRSEPMFALRDLAAGLSSDVRHSGVDRDGQLELLADDDLFAPRPKSTFGSAPARTLKAA